MAEPESSTTQQTAMLQQWESLKTQAENGELSIDEDIGRQLMKRCTDFIARLETMLSTTNDLSFLAGFGTLRSAEALRNKYAAKAVADTDSAANRLKTSIDIVTLMQQTFELSIRRVEETDQSTSNALGDTGA